MNQYISKCISVFVFSPTNFHKRIHPLTYILGLTEVMAGDWRLRLHILISCCCRFSEQGSKKAVKKFRLWRNWSRICPNRTTTPWSCSSATCTGTSTDVWKDRFQNGGQLLRKWWYCPLNHFFKFKQIQESSQVHRCWCHIVKLNSTFLTLLLYLYIWCLLLITEVLTVDLNMSTFCLTSFDSVGASTSCLKPTTTNVLINTHCAWLLSECSCSGSYKLCTHGSTQLSCPDVFQSSGLLQEEPDVHSGHRHRVRPNADVARAGRRKHGGQHGLPEPDRRVHPHREPTNLQPGQEVKRPGSEVDRIIWRTHIYTSKLKNNQVPSEMLSFKQETEAVSCFVEK